MHGIIHKLDLWWNGCFLMEGPSAEQLQLNVLYAWGYYIFMKACPHTRNFLKQLNLAVHQAGYLWITPGRGVTTAHSCVLRQQRADVNFRRRWEMQESTNWATDNSKIIPQLFRIWSTNPINISTLSNPKYLQNIQVMREGEGGKLGELTKMGQRLTCEVTPRARDMPEKEWNTHRISLSENSPHSQLALPEMEAFRETEAVSGWIQLCDGRGDGR